MKANRHLRGLIVLDICPMHQWILSVPSPLRFLFASLPKVMGKALGIVYRTKAAADTCIE
jgi:hypothetical protein